MQNNPYYTEVPVGYYTQQRRPQQQPKQGTGYQVGNTAGKVVGGYGTKVAGNYLTGSGSNGITLSSGTPGATMADGSIGTLASDGSVVAGTEGTGSSLGSSLGAGSSSWGTGSIAGNALGAVGAGYGAYNAYQGIKKGDPALAGMGGLSAGMGGAALAGVGTGMSTLGSLAAMGPYGLAAAAVMGAAAYGQQQRWGKGSKGVGRLRREMIQDRFQELGLLDQNIGGIEGATGFDFGDGNIIHVGEGDDERYRLGFSQGELDPDVFINEVDREHLRKKQEQGYRYADTLDWAAPGTGLDVAAANPLAYLVAGGNGPGGSSQIATYYLANALGATENDGDFLKGLYSKIGYEGESGANQMIADIGALKNAGQLGEWDALAAQNQINKQFGLAGYGAGGDMDNLAIDPTHQAAFDAYNAEQEKIRALG